MSRTSTLLSVLAVALFGIQNASAQIVPFHSEGTGNQYDTKNGVFSGPGITAHLGKSSGLGLAVPYALPDTDPDYGNPLVSGWLGQGSFTAANGDSIEFVGGGKIYLMPLGDGWFTAAWVGKFSIQDIDEDGDAGTGRFSSVAIGTAPLDVIAINDPFQLDGMGNPLPDDVWTYDYLITGDMDLGKKKTK